jgi:peroxiredoxin
MQFHAYFACLAEGLPVRFSCRVPYRGFAGFSFPAGGWAVRFLVAAVVSFTTLNGFSARGEDAAKPEVAAAAESKKETGKADGSTDSPTTAEPPKTVGAFFGAAAKAKSKEPKEPQPGHSSHGEVFDDGPRQAAYLMGGTGKVHLPVTTTVPGVQELFDQGVGQLHGFWYFEAERTFRQVAALDPQCAMAYWGMAMANINNEKRAKQFIGKAVERKAQASPREALWIDSLAAFYKAGDKDGKAEEKEDKTRRRELVRALEQIVQDYPDELEAKAFLALQIWLNSSKGLPINSHQAVDSLLSEVFAAEPYHPAHHYRIHLWDKEKPARAIESAARCGASAPTIAHMWHMPGHIYSGLHRYGEAAWQQEASARADHAHMIRDRILPDQIHNYAHNNEWLIRDMLHVGRVHEALALAKNMIELPRHPEYNVPTKTSSSQYGRARLLDVLTRYELWDELVALAHSPYLEPTDIPAEQIKRLRALGAAQIAAGDTAAAAASLATLEEMLAKVNAAQQTAGEEAEKKARDEKKNDEEIAKAKEAALKGKEGDAKPIEKAIAELQGRAALAAGKFDDAKTAFAKADDLDKAFEAHVALATGDCAKAEQLAKEAVEKGPGEALPLARYTDILWRAGKTAEAKAEFEKLRALSARFDLDAPPFKRLAPIAQELGLNADWRVPVTTAADFGTRPPLDSLGPLHWHPSAAESWSLVDAQGKAVSLRDFAGKPVVVVFYLGFGCLHCVEQLKALEPLVDEFAAAGISLVAISSETSEQLNAALAKRAATEGAPKFPILVDPALATFRQYRAFDDFEQTPLHGTFFIDGAGLVRWQDVGPEPFMDLKFVLGEAKRLLAMPSR